MKTVKGYIYSLMTGGARFVELEKGNEPENFIEHEKIEVPEGKRVIIVKDESGQPTGVTIEDIPNYKTPLEIRKEQKRIQRDMKIRNIEWLTSRHMQEQALGIPTTLIDAQYMEVLNYIQALRDVTKQPSFEAEGNVEFPEELKF